MPAPEVRCTVCARPATPPAVMFEMEPGKDKSEWRLCSRCYAEGLKPIVVER